MNAQLQIRAWKPVRLLRRADQVHIRLLGRAAALFLIAGLAGGDDVFPALAAALDDRGDVIEGQVVTAEVAIAVLANVIVAQKDIGARNGRCSFCGSTGRSGAAEVRRAP